MPRGPFKRGSEWNGKAQFWFNKQDMEIILDGLNLIKYSDDNLYKDKLIGRIKDEYEKRHGKKADE